MFPSAGLLITNTHKLPHCIEVNWRNWFPNQNDNPWLGFLDEVSVNTPTWLWKHRCPTYQSYHYWLVVSTPLNNISQLGWLFLIYGKINNVPNHQPVVIINVASLCQSIVGIDHDQPLSTMFFSNRQSPAFPRPWENQGTGIRATVAGRHIMLSCFCHTWRAYSIYSLDMHRRFIG